MDTLEPLTVFPDAEPLDRKKACEKCELLHELWQSAEQHNRNYWIMTQLFVMLHDGKDYCENSC